MRVVKSVKQNHHASPEILGLLQDFRQMVNDCIRIGLDERITSMRKLSLACYGKLAAYDVPTCYRLTAISKAAGILSNYRKKLKANPDTKRPYAKRLVLADCYGFRIFDRLLKMLYRRGEYVFVILNDHTLKSISGHSARSITLTPDSLSICYSKEVVQIEPRGGMGIDCNLDNVTIAMTDGSVKKFDLSRATQVKQIYRQVKARFTRNDARIRKRIFGKYGSLQGNRVQHILHDASSRIVQRAKADGLAIVMENLKGIRKLYRKGNGQSKSYRAKLNSWSYHELQRQVEYKAKWEGLPVIYVAARGTTTDCSICGGKTIQSPNGHRILRCNNCRRDFDRDENAARNILRKGGLRFKPNGSPGEAQGTMQEPEGSETAILTVDGEKMATEASA